MLEAIEARVDHTLKPALVGMVGPCALKPSLEEWVGFLVSPAGVVGWWLVALKPAPNGHSGRIALR